MLLQVEPTRRQRIPAASFGCKHVMEITSGTRVNALGVVELSTEHAEVGYSSHPAAVDSSMHLSVFSQAADGQTRVPGVSAKLELGH